MKRTNEGFTKLELLFVMLASGLVALPAISLLGSNKSETDRAACFNNLRQVGRAFQSWGNDHGDRFPWAVPPPEGGMFGDSLGVNAWIQVLSISNHLPSPRPLVCPADGISRPAENWTSGSGGFANVTYRNAALSYIVALHARPDTAGSVLSADRNLRISQVAVCSFAPSGVQLPQLSPLDPNVAWTNSIHGRSGHLLFADGSVFFSSSSDLRATVRQGNDDNGSGIHYLSR